MKFFAFKQPKSKEEVDLTRKFLRKKPFETKYCTEIGLGPQYYIPPAKSNNQSTYRGVLNFSTLKFSSVLNFSTIFPLR